MKYRKDIDGLRAIAIFSVLVFHFNHYALPSGFIGVDMFFVISGYLITMVLLREHESFAFINLKNFYLRRIKRIIPSLYLVLLVTWIAGYFILLPSDFYGLSKSMKSVLLFYSNFYFARGSDYFSPSSDELHYFTPGHSQ